jgi:hypothetical protein
MMLVVIETMQVTMSPFPLAEPLHWSMMSGRVRESPVTLQVTNEPPPLAEPLHWFTVGGMGAPDVFGGQIRSEPPPSAEPTHWITETSTRSSIASPETLLMIVTLQITVEPPAFAELSHCVIEVIEVPVKVVQVRGPAPTLVQTICVEVPSLPVKLLISVTLQVIVWAAPVSLKLHWLTLVLTPAARSAAIASSGAGTFS